MTLDECERHFKAVRASTSVAEACHLLGPLLDVYGLMNVAIGRSTTFWRARVAGPTPWADMSQMNYPPAKFAALGRLNEKGSPIFYAASREDTALAEIGIKPGEHVQVAGFRMRAGAAPRLVVIGELFHVYKAGYLRTFGTDPGRAFNKTINRMSFAEARMILYIDAFLADLLADATAAASDYMLSKAVASMVMRRPYVDGFFFPSVKDTHGMNFALKPDVFDATMEMVCCTHGRVHKVRQFGLVDHEVIRDARPAEDGQLVWMPSVPGRRAYFNITSAEAEAQEAEATAR